LDGSSPTLAQDAQLFLNNHQQHLNDRGIPLDRQVVIVDRNKYVSFCSMIVYIGLAASYGYIFQDWIGNQIHNILNMGGQLVVII